MNIPSLSLFNLTVFLMGYFVWREYKMMTSEIFKLKETVKNLSDSVLHKHEKLEELETSKIQTLKKIQKEIENLNTDKTGRTDFALESTGGSIVKLSHGTENYGQPKSSLLDIAICEGIHGPRSIIQKGTSPGECWALKGTTGGVIIRLFSAVKIDAVTMEHISKNISPNGDTSTAPKDFSVWGLKTQTDRGQMLGQFQYDINGPLVQTFPIPSSISTPSFEFVELKIVSNHGNPDFTCVYRFRVHGTMERK